MNSPGGYVLHDGRSGERAPQAAVGRVRPTTDSDSDRTMLRRGESTVVGQLRSVAKIALEFR